MLTVVRLLLGWFSSTTCLCGTVVIQPLGIRTIGFMSDKNILRFPRMERKLSPDLLHLWVFPFFVNMASYFLLPTTVLPNDEEESDEHVSWSQTDCGVPEAGQHSFLLFFPCLGVSGSASNRCQCSQLSCIVMRFKTIVFPLLTVSICFWCWQTGTLYQETRIYYSPPELQQTDLLVWIYKVSYRENWNSSYYKFFKTLLVDEEEDCITLHAVAEESVTNIDVKCVFADEELITTVAKIEDGYKLKYDVYQVIEICTKVSKIKTKNILDQM